MRRAVKQKGLPGLNGDELIHYGDLWRSFYYEQDDILKAIQAMHAAGPFDADVTFGFGGFYVGAIERPRLVFDIEPKKQGVISADAGRLPLSSGSLGSIVLDPPFLAGSSKGQSIMARYGKLESIRALVTSYGRLIAEAGRVLRRGGILVIKCQDITHGRDNFPILPSIYKAAIGAGFMPLDLFLLLAKNRPTNHNMISQQHARKFHSYFVVVRRSSRRAAYFARRLGLAEWSEG